MASRSPSDPPSYLESLSCQVLKSKKSLVVVTPPVPDDDTFDHGYSTRDVHDGASTDEQGALERVRAATEANAAEFIWSELPKQLKMQWAQSDLRAALDECPRLASPHCSRGLR